MKVFSIVQRAQGGEMPPAIGGAVLPAGVGRAGIEHLLAIFSARKSYVYGGT